MAFRLEHANITVASIDEVVTFLTAAFPQFNVRGSSQSETDGREKRWLHVGTHETYIALEEIIPPFETDRKAYREPGINHVGFVVDDLDALIRRLQDAGYETSDLAEDVPYRKRTYIFDKSGNEWEFVQYLTDDPDKANTYA